MNRTVTLLIWINLGVIGLLVFIFPHLMIAPGSLMPAHSRINTDCFACHDPLFGVSDAKCAGCHKVKEIGVTTTKGVPLTDKKSKIPFHQKMLGQNCVACHSDHAGIAKFRVSGRFSHNLLEEPTRNQCIDCHQRPGDPLHRHLSETCSQCHDTNRWKPAPFKHDLLPAAQRQQCVACHKAKTPSDPLHRQASDQCVACHTVTRWQPATYHHDPWFLLDKNHNVKCATCHLGEGFKTYTCYGCHEHRVDKIRKKHIKEGMNDFERCVLCHRSADEHAAKALWRSGRWRDGVSGTPSRPGDGGAGWSDKSPERSEAHGERRDRRHKEHEEED